MKILLAVDGSAYTTKAVDFVLSKLDWFKGQPELHLLTVKAPIPIGHVRSVIGKEDLEDYYQDECRAALNPAEKLLQGSGVPFQSHYSVGDVADEIQAFAKKNNIDLVVMGSHGQGSLRNLVMGSVATKVLASTTLPVLIVR
jgi:nucleotide-binding universal stress UspA family protein